MNSKERKEKAKSDSERQAEIDRLKIEFKAIANALANEHVNEYSTKLPFRYYFMKFVFYLLAPIVLPLAILGANPGSDWDDRLHWIRTPRRLHFQNQNVLTESNSERY